MKLLEYEAKAFLKSAQIAVPTSLVITTQTDDISAPVVLKSQVPIGGRGKLGGIKVIDTDADITPAIAQLFALDIKGHKPRTILAEQKLAIASEYYLSLIINRQREVIELIAHKEGGIEVEDNASHSFLRLDMSSQNWDALGTELAEYYELPEQTFALQDLLERLYGCFIKNDATLIEINPLVLTADNTLIAGDCKMTLDDATQFRHPDWNFEDSIANTNFVTLNPDGNIATIANGAGLAMATVDAVANRGMNPINFLDIGGGANSESVLAAFHQIMGHTNVRGIVINIFAGITRCDEVAKAIIEARAHIAELPPLFIRLAGTNVDKAATLLSEHNIQLLPTLESCLDAAAQEVLHG